MADFQKIKINEIEYNIIDSIQDFRAEDSFIHRNNKLSEFGGNGEARKYVGSYKQNNIKTLSSFFEYDKWGVEYKDEEKGRKTMDSALPVGAAIQRNTCFFSKKNLLKYLKDAKTEYYKQEQIYHNDISTYYEERYNEITSIDSEYIYFSIYDVSDNINDKQNRGYIRSDDQIWNIWRKLILPKISYLSILKLLPVDKHNTTPLFYFRILLDYQYRSIVHPSIFEIISKEDTKEKETRKKAYRIGQDKYRRSVIEHMVQCPFTKITDERLLVASHIKPYRVCIAENNIEEALDQLNGLSLSPTYDWLFDQGYITFTDEGKLICGTQLSPYTWAKLNINPTKQITMNILPEKREKYLKYHRENVFLDNIEDLI